LKYVGELRDKYEGGYQVISIDDLDLNRLNGIQKGIKVFEGMHIREIILVISLLKDIAINRGCSNNCTHCGHDAKPKEEPPNWKNARTKNISEMSWSDFKDLTDGVKDLRARIGCEENIDFYYDDSASIAPFVDSDCIEIEMHGRGGKKYDITDVVDGIWDGFGKETLVDTSGWYKKHRKRQQRAEKIVDYFSKEENVKKLHILNISMNPFHSTLEKSLGYKQSGEHRKSEKFKNLYIDRMVNVLYTFTPLFDKLENKFQVLRYGFENSDKECPVEHTKGWFEQNIYNEIIENLKEKYREDNKSEEEIEKIVNYINLSVTSGGVSDAGRAKELKGKKQSKSTWDIKRLYEYVDRKMVSITLDSNGRPYAFLGEYAAQVPLEAELNFRNINKNTRDFVCEHKSKKVKCYE